MSSFKQRQERLDQMKARLKDMESEQKTAARKRENRRLILMGRWVENKIKSNRLRKEDLLNDLNQYLTRNDERELFELPPLENPPQKEKKTAPKKADAQPTSAPVEKKAEEKIDEKPAINPKKKLKEGEVSLNDFNL